MRRLTDAPNILLYDYSIRQKKSRDLLQRVFVTGNKDFEVMRHLIGNPGSAVTYTSPTKAGEDRYGAAPDPYTGR